MLEMHTAKADGEGPSSLPQRLYNNVTVVFDTHFWLLVSLLLASNLSLCFFVISRVAYTEIDWVAYMQEVAGVIKHGELDYLKLRGDTGPLVYPAGFVWLYAILYRVTDGGVKISIAQYMFALLHTTTVGVAAFILRRASPRPTSPLLICALFVSRRSLSLFVLRLFNDAPQTLLSLIFVALAVTDRWNLACLFYTFALSVKMNALLYGPALVLLLCQARGALGALKRLVSFVVLPQIAFAIPFLYGSPRSYITRAFELSRVFEHRWSVNGAFLSSSTFQSKHIAFLLLTLHVCTLLAFGQWKWTEPNSLGLFGLLGFRREGPRSRLKLYFRLPNRRLAANHVVTVLFTCNFIGIVFARTLHYQFYLWYVYSLPYLVYIIEVSLSLKFAILAIIEVVFNIYPPNPLTSISLHVAHIALLGALASLPNPRTFFDYAYFARRRME